MCICIQYKKQERKDNNLNINFKIILKNYILKNISIKKTKKKNKKEIRPTHPTHFEGRPSPGPF
jgi:hypothetical protein